MRNRQVLSAESIEENDETSDASDVESTQQKRWLISRWFTPNSILLISWQTFIFMAIWYNSLVTPIRLFIIPLDRTPRGIVDADIVFDFIFVVDTILNFFIPYTDETTGEVITDPKAIRQRYTGSVNFFINVIACIPILKTPISLFLDSGSQRILVTNFNILRMIRVLHFPSQFQQLKRYRSRNGPVNESVFRMWVILFFAFLSMCILGCVYFGWSTAAVNNICPSPSDFESEILNIDMWVADDFVITDVMDPNVCGKFSTGPKCNDCPQMLFLTRSIYFLMQTLFTIGYGDSVVPSKSVVEMAMACVFMIFGVFGYGLIIANMTSVLANVDVVSMRFRHDMDNITRWMTLRSVPQQLRDRVRMFFTYLNKNQSGMLDHHLFADLPPKLTQDFANQHLEFLTKVPFFDPTIRSESFLRKIANVLIRRIYPPGSYILYQYEKQRELVIIKKGGAEIFLKGSDDPIGYLRTGDFMGDYQLLFGTVNQVGLRSQDFTEVLALTFENMEKVMGCEYEDNLDFRSLGGNFRRSQDNGALQTIRLSIMKMEKIAQKADNAIKVRNSMRELQRPTDNVIRGYRIYPDSKLNVFWDIFALIAIMHYSISCPVLFATFYRFGELSRGSLYINITTYIIDLCFIFDIYLRMKVYAYTCYDTGRNEVIDDQNMMTKHYISSNSFKLDVVAAIPLDILAIFIGQHPAIRFTKVIRALQIPHIVSSLQQHLEDSCNIILTETSVSCLLMFLYSVLIIVWISSGWYAIRPGESAYDSVYWALTTITTVGYGDLTPIDLSQTVFALFVGAIGATFSAAIIANVTSFFHDVELSEQNIDHKLNCVKYFMERHNTSLDHIKKVQDYFDFIERDQDGLNEEELLKSAIPDHIRSNILTHITQSMILNSNFFADCESGFIRKVMLSIEQRFYGTDFMIINSLTPSDGMFFVKRGVVEILKKKTDGTFKVIKNAEANESFAEGCLLEHWTENPFLARAKTESEIWFLSRSTFNRLIEDFPLSRSVLQNKVNKNENRVSNSRNSVFKIQKINLTSQRFGFMYIHPDNFFIKFWFGLILLVILYNIVILPFRIAFMENYEISSIWLVFDYLGDLFFLADIIVRGCFLAYYDDNRLVTNGKRIWLRYYNSGKMKWHILSIIPFEIITIFHPTFCPFWSLQLWSIFRLNRVLMVVEISYMFQKVESSLAKAGVKVPKNPLRVGKLLMISLLSAHWVACIFFVIANLNHHSDSSENENNWASAEGLFPNNPECPGNKTEFNMMMRQYVASLYFSIATLTTVGYGDITASEDSAPEIIFATVILIIGTAIYTLVIALLEDIVSQLDVTSSLYKMKMNNVDTYTQTQGIPDSIKTKTSAYYDQLWRSQLGMKGKRLLRYMPRSIRCDIKMDMLSHQIEKTFFVKSCTADFVAAIVDSLSFEAYLPDDVLFHEGERCDSLFFIYSGEVGLFTSKMVKFKTMSNCLLCEGFFFSFEPHICTGKAMDSCEIFQLSMNDLLKLLKENNMSDQFLQYIEQNEDKLIQSKASIQNMIKNLKSTKMAKMMVEEVDTSIPKRVILPDSKFRQIWDLLALIAAFIFAITIPQQISFSVDDTNTAECILDLILDIFFVSDLYARMNHFAVFKDGALISNPSEFRKIYLKNEFWGDLISVIPVSTIGWAIGVNGRSYGLMRLFQMTRLKRFAKYLSSCIETLYEVFNIVISTAVMRILQMFILVVILCHWLGCVYHLIGDLQNDNENWLNADGIKENTIYMRYVRSFYWALYTVTTVGYGSVPVISNSERIFAMFVMSVGAVICDAGITAVLTSIISNKDRQAGTNNRRIQCCKKFMLSNFIDKETQNCVLDFYRYIDTEVKNVDEADILGDLSPSIKSEILQTFCFEHLRKCYALQDFSDGALISLLNLMSPYIAIPGEKICEIGKISDSIFVLQRGRMYCMDEKGAIANLSIGAVIGHMISNEIQKVEDLPSKFITMQIVSSTGLKGKSNPYVEIEYGSTIIRSSIRTGKEWTDMMTLKVNGNCKDIKIRVKGWHKNAKHTLLGEGNIELESEGEKVAQASLVDLGGKKVGSLTIKVTFNDLLECNSLSTLEMTSIAEGYCHLYRLEVTEIENMRRYLIRSKLPKIKDRVPINMNDLKIGISPDEEGDGKMHNSNQNNEKRKTIQQLWHEIHTKKKSPINVQRGMEMEEETTQTKKGKEETIGEVKTSDEEGQTKNSQQLDSTVDSMDENLQESNTIDWDNLVKFPDPTNMVNHHTTRGSNFFVEWANESE